MAPPGVPAGVGGSGRPHSARRNELEALNHGCGTDRAHLGTGARGQCRAAEPLRLPVSRAFPDLHRACCPETRDLKQVPRTLLGQHPARTTQATSTHGLWSLRPAAQASPGVRTSGRWKEAACTLLPPWSRTAFKTALGNKAPVCYIVSEGWAPQVGLVRALPSQPRPCRPPDRPVSLSV